jgi:hypothetical protein
VRRQVVSHREAVSIIRLWHTLVHFGASKASLR